MSFRWNPLNEETVARKKRGAGEADSGMPGQRKAIGFEAAAGWRVQRVGTAGLPQPVGCLARADQPRCEKPFMIGGFEARLKSAPRLSFCAPKTCRDAPALFCGWALILPLGRSLLRRLPSKAKSFPDAGRRVRLLGHPDTLGNVLLTVTGSAENHRNPFVFFRRPSKPCAATFGTSCRTPFLAFGHAFCYGPKALVG